MNARPKIIINADDLGYDEATNKRIFQAFDQRWISSATIMANMPGFNAAAKRVAELGLEDSVGLHITLDTGPAISKAMRLLSDNQQLSVGRQLLIRDKRLLIAIKEEILTQIDVARKAGLKLSHVDSHHHLHTHWSVLTAVIGACLDNVPAARLAGNLLFPSAPHKRLYRAAVNRRIQAAGLCTVHQFTYLDRYLEVEPAIKPGTVVELMVHPGVDSEYKLFQTDAFFRLKESCDFINYTDLCKDLVQR